jgi:hypothetical protein
MRMKIAKSCSVSGRQSAWEVDLAGLSSEGEAIVNLSRVADAQSEGNAAGCLGMCCGTSTRVPKAARILGPSSSPAKVQGAGAAGAPIFCK